jgi:hypothetical protein
MDHRFCKCDETMEGEPIPLSKGFISVEERECPVETREVNAVGATGAMEEGREVWVPLKDVDIR